MKQIGLILVILTMGIMLIQCGGEKEEPMAKAPEKPAATDAVEASGTSDAMAEMSYDLDNGEAIYKKFCFACHDAGLAGAARHADKERWTESAAKGVPTLVSNVTNGYQGKYGIIPPKGTCMECSDQDIIDAVHYQLSMGGVLE